MSGVPQGSVLKLVVFIFVNDIDDKIECILRRSAVDIKLSGAIDKVEERDAIQRDMDKLKKWANVNLVRFNKAKCKVLHFSGVKLRCVYRLGGELLDSNPTKKCSGL